jgi:hypothetical protein
MPLATSNAAVDPTPAHASTTMRNRQARRSQVATVNFQKFHIE